MKFLLFLFYLLIPVFITYSQSFEKTYGTIDDDAGNAVEVCHDGSYIITGNVQNIYTGDNDIYVARINIFGDTIWTRTIVNPYHWDSGADVIQCLDLGFAVTGSTYDDESGKPFLAKFTENGQLEWYRKYETEIPDGYAHTIVQNPDSTFVICGRRNYYNTDWYHHPFLLKASRNGDCQWFKEYSGFTGVSINNVNDMCLSSDNEFILGGNYKDLKAYYPIYNSWLFNVHANSYLGWSNTYVKDGYTTSAVDVDLTADKGYIFVGTTYPGDIILPGEDFDIFVVKTDSSGNEEWRTTIGYLDEGDHGNCIAPTIDGNYIIGGQRDYGSDYDDIWLIKIEEDGDTIWSSKFGGSNNDYISDIELIPDGGFILCGTTFSYGLGGSDIYLIRTDQDGIVTGNIELDINKEEVNIYPNPCNDVINIDCPPGNYIYTIQDVSGRLLLKNEITGGFNKKLRLSNLKTGFYILNILSGSYSQSFKIVKQ
ncbi:MAG: T9SS type A sorting domain-containing protein [Bacteroidales bacterium]|nr:T9SS type A sorting domain-containing protein [Bacteroidales bacterium]